jgi:hypothetical protein
MPSSTGFRSAWTGALSFPAASSVSKLVERATKLGSATGFWALVSAQEGQLRDSVHVQNVDAFRHINDRILRPHGSRTAGMDVCSRPLRGSSTSRNHHSALVPGFKVVLVAGLPTRARSREFQISLARIWSRMGPLKIARRFNAEKHGNADLSPEGTVDQSIVHVPAKVELSIVPSGLRC